LFTPALLLLLVPLAVAGTGSIPTRRSRMTLLVPIVLTVVLYSVYQYTALHPRFFYVVLPLVLVLDACGAVAIVSWSVGRRREKRSYSVSESGNASPGR
jgi:hypothetical protein